MKPILDTSKYQNSLNVLTVSCMDSSTVKRIVLVKGPSWRVLGGGRFWLFTRVNVRGKKREEFSLCYSVTPNFRVSRIIFVRHIMIYWTNERIFSKGTFKKNASFGIYGRVLWFYEKFLKCFNRKANYIKKSLPQTEAKGS